MSNLLFLWKLLHEKGMHWTNFFLPPVQWFSLLLNISNVTKYTWVVTLTATAAVRGWPGNLPRAPRVRITDPGTAVMLSGSPYLSFSGMFVGKIKIFQNTSLSIVNCPMQSFVWGRIEKLFWHPSGQAHRTDYVKDSNRPRCWFYHTHTRWPLLLTGFSPEGPVELLLRRPAGCHIDGEQKLFKVNKAVSVCVESSEDMITEVINAANREAFAVDLQKRLGWGWNGWNVNFTFMKASGLSFPSGQSCLNPLYHSHIVSSKPAVLANQIL